MIDLTRNNRNKAIPRWSKKQRNLRRAIFGLVLAAVTLTILLSASFATTTASSLNTTSNVTQFKLETAYAFVGKTPSKMSYTASNGVIMHPSSQYPSAVILRITRLPGVQIPSCDAEIEVYGVKISSGAGSEENHVYFVGTNYKSSFSDSELSILVERANDIVDQSVFTDARGNFNFNWTDNESITSHVIGSAGYYWNMPTTLGLWATGKPDTILVSIHRIGSITTTEGSVTIHKDTESREATPPIQLDSYEGGFFYNTLVPTKELSQTDLFQPIP
jgi:hypothetical protein